MVLRNKDIRKIISTIMLGVGSFWLVADYQEAINNYLGVNGSAILGIMVLLIAGYMFNLD